MKMARSISTPSASELPILSAAKEKFSEDKRAPKKEGYG
jgi:hypothetical protein